jgi:hypothetical protein
MFYNTLSVIYGVGGTWQNPWDSLNPLNFLKFGTLMTVMKTSSSVMEITKAKPDVVTQNFGRVLTTHTGVNSVVVISCMYAGTLLGRLIERPPPSYIPGPYKSPH